MCVRVPVCVRKCYSKITELCPNFIKSCGIGKSYTELIRLKTKINLNYI
jgi:hypothetical protein